MGISLFKLINFAITEVVKRSIVIALVMLVIYTLTKKGQNVFEKYPDTKWNTKSIYLLLFLFLLIEYSLFFLLGGIFYGDLLAFFSKIAPWRYSLAGFLFVSFVLVVIWFVVTKRYHQPFSTLGFQKNRLKSGLIWGFCILLFYELYFVSAKYFRVIPISTDEKHIDLFWLLSMIIITPIAEEVFYRGYIYPNFRKRVGVLWAILLSSICFTILHQMEEEWIYIFMYGIIYCFIYEKSSSLIAPIIGHVISNIVSVMIKYNYAILIYYIPWPVIWVVVGVTFLIWLLIPRDIPLAISPISSVEVKKPSIEDSEKIIRKATRKGWIVAIILGIAIVYFLYFFKK